MSLSSRRSEVRRVAAILALALPTAQRAVAQGRIEARDSAARMERVADGVYAIIHDNATEDWPHGNTGVIVGDDGVLVVDATYLPSRARADIALIRSVTPKPVRYLVYTHWHFDHNNGGIAYRDTFPGVKVVSERNTRKYVELNGTWWSKMQSAPDSPERRALARREEWLSAGRDSAGAALATEVRSELTRNIAQRKGELAELASLRVVTPDVVFDSTLTLSLGRRRVQLRNWGRANSPDDVTVYLPAERVLFTGDILVQDPMPYTGASWPVSWVDVLRRLESVPVRAVVPGHGPVMPDHSYTRQVRSLMEAVVTRVESMARQGLTLDQIQSTIDLEDVRRSVPVWTGYPNADSEWKQITRVLVERAWRGVRGQG